MNANTPVGDIVEDTNVPEPDTGTGGVPAQQALAILVKELERNKMDDRPSPDHWHDDSKSDNGSS